MRAVWCVKNFLNGADCMLYVRELSHSHLRRDDRSKSQGSWKIQEEIKRCNGICELDPTFCHDTQSPLGANEQFRSVETCRGLPCSSARLDDFTIGQNHGLRDELGDYPCFKLSVWFATYHVQKPLCFGCTISNGIG